MRFFRAFLLFIICYLLIVVRFSAVHALSNPLSAPNNKFGIGVATADDRDLVDAAALVNSSQGSWGYVTLVIQENDRDVGKWQNVFNRLRRLRLIPIIRLATKPEGAVWRRPTEVDANGWVEFLNKLNWVVENRYIILFNEPNHASEWGGDANPEDYGTVAFAFAQAFKKSNADYFIMLAGFDQAAPLQPPRYFEEGNFLSRMFTHLSDEKKDLGQYVDGWSSHSYPNPGFAGSVDDDGKGTIRGYQWELSYINQFISKELPVFITETGWERRGGISEEMVSANYKRAFQDVWLTDKRVAAVTPFLLNYQGDPFLGFSWRKFESDEYFSIYKTIQDMPKKAGQPRQHAVFDVVGFLPTELGASSQFKFLLHIKNTGQTIWDIRDGYEFALVSDRPFKYFFPIIADTEPGVQNEMSFIIETPEEIGSYPMQIALLHNNKIESLWAWRMKVIPNIDITLNYKLFLSLFQNNKNFTVEIYDPQEHLVFKKAAITGADNKITLKKVRNLAVGERYRVVLLKEGNLPRQEFVTIQRDANSVVLKPLLPFDWDHNGTWTFHDLVWFLK